MGSPSQALDQVDRLQMAAAAPCRRRDRRLLVQLCCVLVLCSRAVHSDEDDDFLRRGEAHDALDGYHPSSGDASRALHEAGISKAGSSRAEQEARAQALMADSEQDEQQVEQAAQKYRVHLKAAKERNVDLGEAMTQPSTPHISPEAERIKHAMQEFDRQQHGEALDNAESHPDLGEAMDSSSAERGGNTGANALTARAQSKAREKAEDAAKRQSAAHAKKIAAKVQKLVAVQRHLEDEASIPHNGMVNLKESMDATNQLTQTAKSSMEDSLVAQKMEAEAAQSTFKNLIEHEREEQRKVLEHEREKAASVLESVKKTLLKKQASFMAQIGAAEKKVEAKLQHSLGKTQVAQAVETEVKRKLAKRVEELTTAGKLVVGGVTDSVSSLKRRVRRLRRSQDRMKSEQSTIEQSFASQKTESTARSDLGESAHSQQLEQELQQMQMSMMRQNLPQQNFLPGRTQRESSAELENVVLKQKLQIAELKNQLLEKLSSNTASKQQPLVQDYSGQSMQKFFQKRKQRTMHNNQERTVLAKQIQKEQESLNRVKAELGEAQPQNKDQQLNQMGMQADVFLQVPDDSNASDLPNAAMYHMHKNAAYADSKSIQDLAMENSLEILHTQV